MVIGKMFLLHLLNLIKLLFSRLLKDNPGLLQLYKDLVITQVITSEEFWNEHALKYVNKPNHLSQQVGISSAFLVSIFVLSQV